jgi:hypothetical protein
MHRWLFTDFATLLTLGKTLVKVVETFPDRQKL